jgi:hypothetical protein
MPVTISRAGTAMMLLAATWLTGCQCANGDLVELDSDASSSSSTAPPPPTSTSTSASTSTSTSTSADASDDATSSSFLISPEGAICLVSGDEHWHCWQCEIFAQDCAAGSKCMPWAHDGGNAWSSTRCSPVAENPGQLGDVCTAEGSGVSGIDDCDIGLMCWNVEPETNVGTCVAMCTGDQANLMCPEGDSCMMANDGVLFVCLPPCDPLMIGACPEGQTCTAVNEDPVCIPSVGVEVRPCGGAVCDPDQTCQDGEVLEACMASGCCTPWCDLTEAAPNAACAAEPAHSCQPYYEPGAAPTGLERLGVCRLPA